MRRVAALLTLLGLAHAGCRGDAASATRVAALRGEYDQLRSRLEGLVADDVELVQAAEAGGEIAVALHTRLVAGVLEEVSRRYLDRVELDMDREVRIRTAGEVKTKTFLGTLKAGQWALDLTVHRVRGVFHARSPRVSLTGANKVRLGLVAALEGARGVATLRFAWDANGVASVMCSDFEITRRLEGLVLPEEYPIAGSLLIAAGPDSLLARPQFPDRPFRLRIDLTPESWGEVRAALESQDTLGRCGIALDPEALLPRLKELTRGGFDIRLPRSLFRVLELPASVRSSVSVQGRQVDLVVEPLALRAAPDALWYSVAARSRIRAEGPR